MKNILDFSVFTIRTTLNSKKKVSLFKFIFCYSSLIVWKYPPELYIISLFSLKSDNLNKLVHSIILLLFIVLLLILQCPKKPFHNLHKPYMKYYFCRPANSFYIIAVKIMRTTSSLHIFPNLINGMMRYFLIMLLIIFCVINYCSFFSFWFLSKHAIPSIEYLNNEICIRAKRTSTISSCIVNGRKQ